MFSPPWTCFLSENFGSGRTLCGPSFKSRRGEWSLSRLIHYSSNDWFWFHRFSEYVSCIPYPRQESTFQSDVSRIARFRGALVLDPGLRKYSRSRSEGESRGSALFYSFWVSSLPRIVLFLFSILPFPLLSETVLSVPPVLRRRLGQAIWLAFVVFRTYLFLVSEFIAFSDSTFCCVIL